MPGAIAHPNYCTPGSFTGFLLSLLLLARDSAKLSSALRSHWQSLAMLFKAKASSSCLGLLSIFNEHSHYNYKLQLTTTQAPDSGSHFSNTPDQHTRHKRSWPTTNRSYCNFLSIGIPHCQVCKLMLRAKIGWQHDKWDEGMPTSYSWQSLQIIHEWEVFLFICAMNNVVSNWWLFWWLFFHLTNNQNTHESTADWCTTDRPQT